MVLMNFAATRGPKQLWPGYTMRNVDPAITLHDAARLVLKDDADDVVLAHGRQRTADAQFTNLVDVMDADMNDLKQMGISCVKFFLEFDHPPAAAEAEGDLAQEMMEEAKARAATFYWPRDWVDGATQTTRDAANCLLGTLRSNPEEYGGFAKQETADHKDHGLSCM